MGHLRRRAGRDGYYARFRGADGRRREVKLEASTLRKAERQLEALEERAWAERQGLVELRTQEVELDALVEAWHAEVRTHCRPRTWQGCYEPGIRELLPWLRTRVLKRERRPLRYVSQIQMDDVREFARAKMEPKKDKKGKEKQGASARTVNLRVGALIACLNWALREGRIKATPLARWRPLHGPKRKERRALTDNEVMRLLVASPAELRDIWVVFLATGLRAGELAALEWNDIDFERGCLRVRGEVSKSKRTRYVDLQEDSRRVLNRLRLLVAQRPADDEARRFVFVNARGRRWTWNLRKKFKECVRAAKLPESVDLHTLRHTFATALIGLGADVKSVQTSLGHSSATVTLDIYSHELQPQRRGYMERLRVPGAVCEVAPSGASCGPKGERDEAEQSDAPQVMTG